VQKRSPATVVILSIVTLGIYALVWLVQTKNEMNRTYKTEIPTAWLCWVPLWWLWRYSGGVDTATRGKVSQVTSMLLLHVIPIVGIWVIQAKINETLAERGSAISLAA
jgi:hypothetical protein